MKKLKHICIPIIILPFLITCSGENISTSTAFCDETAKIRRATIILPEWLKDINKEIEDGDGIYTAGSATIHVYRGEWNERTVYFIHNTASECLFCNIYYENGEPVMIPAGVDFCRTSSKWRLVYEYKETNGK